MSNYASQIVVKGEWSDKVLEANIINDFNDWFYSQSPTPIEWLMVIGLVFFSAVGICLLMDRFKR